MFRIGVLALQGGFAAHAAAFRDLGIDAEEVRRVDQLGDLEGLVIPGGESTTLLNLMRDEPWFEELRQFHARGGVLFGTCAGAILLAREVVDPMQISIGLLDAVVQRNAYGRQIDSFEGAIEWERDRDSLRAVFIRAPRFRSLGDGADVLGRWNHEPVLVRQGNLLACTFHPELTADRRLHRFFLEMIESEESGRRRMSDVALARRVSC